MSHFAEIDNNGLVLRVLVGDNEMPNEGHDWFVENLGGTWIQTSYNANFRKNFAGAGMTYDAQRNAFIPPKPFDSWILDEDTCQWNAPVEMPSEGEWYWNESLTAWSEIIETENG